MTPDAVASAAPPGVGTRIACFRVLSDVAAGKHADAAARRHFQTLPDRDRGLAMELAFGVIRLRARLDVELSRLVRRPLERVDPELRDWLRLGLFQIRYMRIPDHAAVHATVSAARSSSRARGVGFVNGVLRQAVRRGLQASDFPDWEKDPIGYLCTFGSHPRWLVQRWARRWPLAEVRALVENDNRPPPVVLRWLGEEPTPGDLRPIEGFARSYELEGGDPADILRRLRAVVQDPAASTVVDYIGPDIEGPLLEVCAAPGTKTVALEALASTARPHVAADVNLDRLRLLRDVVPPPAAGLVVMDGRRPALRQARTVILDVPCSGTGVLRRRVDLRWRLTERRLESLIGLQRELLEACAPLVASGGVLVYATCSIEAEENEAQVDRFLDAHREFRRDGIRPAGPTSAFLTQRGDLQVLPWIRGTDGAFAARLRKEGG